MVVGGKTTSVTSLYSRARFTVSQQSRATLRRLVRCDGEEEGEGFIKGP